MFVARGPMSAETRLKISLSNAGKSWDMPRCIHCGTSSGPGRKMQPVEGAYAKESRECVDTDACEKRIVEAWAAHAGCVRCGRKSPIGGLIRLRDRYEDSTAAINDFECVKVARCIKATIVGRE